MDDESSINFASDPQGRRGQLQRWFWELEAKADEFTGELKAMQKAISALHDSDRAQLSNAADAAFAALDEAKKTLLETGDGEQRLTRESLAIISCLDNCVGQFRALSTLSENVFNALGAQSVQLMGLGDTVGTYSRKLDSRSRELSTQVQSMWNVWSEQEAQVNNERQRAGELQSAVNSAESDRDNAGSEIAEFFSSDAKRAADSKVSDAQTRLSECQQRQSIAEMKRLCYYRLVINTSNAASALNQLKQQMETVQAQFHADFHRVFAAQDFAKRTWENMLHMRNEICDPKFERTKDTSLEIVQKVLDDKKNLMSPSTEPAPVQQMIERPFQSQSKGFERMGNPAQVVRSVAGFGDLFCAAA